MNFGLFTNVKKTAILRHTGLNVWRGLIGFMVATGIQSTFGQTFLSADAINVAATNHSIVGLPDGNALWTATSYLTNTSAATISNVYLVVSEVELNGAVAQWTDPAQQWQVNNQIAEASNASLSLSMSRSVTDFPITPGTGVGTNSGLSAFYVGSFAPGQAKQFSFAYEISPLVSQFLEYGGCVSFSGSIAFISQPQSVTAAQGSTVSYTAGVIGSPPFYYQWQLDGTNLTDGGQFTGSQSNVLTITNIQSTVAGNYQVVVSNAGGAVTSFVAALAISQLPPSQFPRVGGFFLSQTSTVKTPLTNGDVLWTTTYQMTNRNAFAVSNLYWVYTGFVLNGADAQWNNIDQRWEVNGVYSFSVNPPLLIPANPALSGVVIQPGFGVTTNSRLPAALIGNFAPGEVKTVSLSQERSSTVTSSSPLASWVQAIPPVFLVEPQSWKTPPGSAILFTTVTAGTPPLFFQWQYNGTNLDDDGGIAGSMTNALSISGISPEYAGVYQLTVMNAYGASSSSNVTLSVLNVPVSFATGRSGIQILDGQVNLQLGGLTGQGPIVIQSSTNLIDWMPIFTNPAGFGTASISNLQPADSPSAFYRAVIIGP